MNKAVLLLSALLISNAVSASGDPFFDASIEPDSKWHCDEIKYSGSESSDNHDIMSVESCYLVTEETFCTKEIKNRNFFTADDKLVATKNIVKSCSWVTENKNCVAEKEINLSSVAGSKPIEIVKVNQTCH